MWDLWRMLDVWERERADPFRSSPLTRCCVFPAESASAAPTEPFDNTTYKNLQHHNYSTYTFLDKPGLLQVQDAPALFRMGVPLPLRAQFKDYPFCVCLHSCLQSSRQSQDPACRILASGELAALLWWFSLHVFRDIWCGDFSLTIEYGSVDRSAQLQNRRCLLSVWFRCAEPRSAWCSLVHQCGVDECSGPSDKT